jgi:hypothetical protein
LAALTKETKLPLGKLYLRGLQINNNARKSKFLTILCATMAHTAEMLLAQFELEGYGKHNLVADFLLSHNKAFLATKTLLLSFCHYYRKINDCDHVPKSAKALFELHFSQAAAALSQPR